MIYGGSAAVKRYTYEIGDPGDGARKHKRALAEHPPSPETVYYHRNGIGDAEGDDGGREDGVKRAARAEKDAAEDNVEEDSQDQSVKGEFQFWVYLGEESGKREAPVSTSC